MTSEPPLHPKTPSPFPQAFLHAINRLQVLALEHPRAAEDVVLQVLALQQPVAAQDVVALMARLIEGHRGGGCLPARRRDRD